MSESGMIMYVFISVIIMLVIALCFVWFLNYAQRKIIKGKLKEQELKLDFQKELLLNTVKTKEKERNRIAKELHDDVSSQLGIINLNLHALKKKVDADPDVTNLIDQIDSSLKKSTDRARKISHELMPLIFRKFGIHQTVKELESNVNLSSVIKLSIVDDYLIRIKDEFKLLHIYRIIQELVNNTLKYAEAKTATLTFYEDGMNITMIYIDDGKGFDLAKASAGLGLSSIKTRVTLLDGEIDLKSTIGTGFQAIIKYPNYD